MYGVPADGAEPVGPRVGVQALVLGVLRHGGEDEERQTADRFVHQPSSTAAESLSLHQRAAEQVVGNVALRGITHPRIREALKRALFGEQQVRRLESVTRTLRLDERRD